MIPAGDLKNLVKPKPGPVPKAKPEQPEPKANGAAKKKGER